MELKALSVFVDSNRQLLFFSLLECHCGKQYTKHTHTQFVVCSYIAANVINFFCWEKEPLPLFHNLENRRDNAAVPTLFDHCLTFKILMM